MVCPYFKKDYGKNYQKACEIGRLRYELPNETHLKLFCVSKTAFEWCAKYRKKNKDSDSFTQKLKLKGPLTRNSK